MGDVVNFNKFRKSRDRKAKEDAARANRTRFGRSRDAKAADRAARDKAKAALDGKKREAPSGAGPKPDEPAPKSR